MMTVSGFLFGLTNSLERKDNQYSIIDGYGNQNIFTIEELELTLMIFLPIQE